MKSMPIATLEDFFASPEFEEAFNRWRAKYTAAAMVDLSPTALEPFPIVPTRWWHVQGELMCNDTVLDGTRIVSATDEAEAINKITQAAQNARGGEWTWVTSPIVVRHAARDDESCHICKQRNRYYQQSDRVNIIRESELMTIIEQSDPKE